MVRIICYYSLPFVSTAVNTLIFFYIQHIQGLKNCRRLAVSKSVVHVLLVGNTHRSTRRKLLGEKARTNLTRRVLESNLGDIGGRRVL